jgi:hypothetical protein
MPLKKTYLGDDEPKPTEVGKSAGLDEVLRVVLPEAEPPFPPDLMLDDLRTELPP